MGSQSLLPSNEVMRRRGWKWGEAGDGGSLLGGNGDSLRRQGMGLEGKRVSSGLEGRHRDDEEEGEQALGGWGGAGGC